MLLNSLTAQFFTDLEDVLENSSTFSIRKESRNYDRFVYVGNVKVTYSSNGRESSGGISIQCETELDNKTYLNWHSYVYEAQFDI